MMFSKAALKALGAIIGFAAVLYLIMQVVFFISPKLKQRFITTADNPAQPAVNQNGGSSFQENSRMHEITVPSTITTVIDTSFKLTRPFIINTDLNDIKFEWNSTAKKESVRVDHVWYVDRPTTHLHFTGAHQLEFRPCKGFPGSLHFKKVRIIRKR